MVPPSLASSHRRALQDGGETADDDELDVVRDEHAQQLGHALAGYQRDVPQARRIAAGRSGAYRPPIDGV